MGKLSKKVLEFAREQGYNDVKFIKKWNGYNCYEPIIFSDEDSFCGLPLVILEKDDEIRMSTTDECFLI